MNTFYATVFCFASCGLTHTLTLSQALNEALEKNPGYQAHRSDTRFAEIARDSGIAGYLPTLTTTGTWGRTWLNTHQERSNGVIQDLDWAKTNSTAAGIHMNWNIFQGFSTRSNQLRLKLQSEQYHALEGNAKEELIRKTVLAFAELLRQQHLKNAADTLAQISAERVRILEKSIALGSASRSDWLSAKVDYNADQANCLRQSAQVTSARATLGKHLGRANPVSENPIPFEIKERISSITDLILGLQNHRADLRMAENTVLLTKLSIKQRTAIWYPKLDALAGYNFALTQSDAGLINQNRSFGPQVGLQLNFNLFSGEWPWKPYQRSKMMLASAEYRNSEIQSAAKFEVLQTYAVFKSLDSATTLEKEGLAMAQENLGLTMLRWKAGALGYLDARFKQEQFLDAVNRSENSEFEAIRAHLDLLRAVGKLESLLEY